MLNPSHITRTLSFLDKKYQIASTPLEAQLLSKLALLELCGWIEEAMDELLLGVANRNLTVVVNLVVINLESYKRDTVRRNSSFEYDKFREMMIKLVGLIVVEKIEAKADPLKIQVLKSTLMSLKTPRNSEAHTHTGGVTRTIDAPSLTKSRLKPVYRGLVEIEKLISTAVFTV